MVRPRTLPDSEVFAVILQMIAAEGEKSVAFAAVARGTGLAGSSLVQRYGNLAQMVEQALGWGWTQLDGLAASVEAESATLDKGPLALLKALTDRSLSIPMAALLAASLRSNLLRARASDWRDRVETMLAARLHDHERAAMLFAAWQGQVLWEGAGDKSFRLKDVLKRLA